jgi:flagellar assembly factor FliW
MKQKTERVSSPRFGEIAYTKNDLYHFPNGLIGLRHYRNFLMLDLDEAGIFHVLQSVDDPAFALVVVDPLLVRPDYRAKVDEAAIDALELDDLADAVVLATVVVPEDPTKMTANLLGPIVVNTKRRTGVQVVLPNEESDVRVPVVDAIRHEEEELHA